MLLAGCGGGSTRTTADHSEASAQEKTKAADLFIVGEDCQKYGASAMLEGSNGADTSSVPDDTSAVCGCWIKWMAESLPSKEVIQMYASLEQVNYIPVTLKSVGGIVSALQTCDVGGKPSTSAQTSPTNSEAQSSAVPSTQGQEHTTSSEAGPFIGMVTAEDRRGSMFADPLYSFPQAKPQELELFKSKGHIIDLSWSGWGSSVAVGKGDYREEVHLVVLGPATVTLSKLVHGTCATVVQNNESSVPAQFYTHISVVLPKPEQSGTATLQPSCKPESE
ncbi:MAG: hypothetical protein ACLPUT_17455 [Solirubrobacteraceae bacterium]